MLVVRDFTGNAYHPAALEGPPEFSQWGSLNLDFLQDPVGDLSQDDFSPSSSTSIPHETVDDALPSIDDVTEKLLVAQTVGNALPGIDIFTEKSEATPVVLAPVERARKRTRRRGFQLPASTRQKNRAAQQRFRLRQKARQEEMVSELDELRRENGSLKDRLAALEHELQKLRSQGKP